MSWFLNITNVKSSRTLICWTWSQSGLNLQLVSVCVCVILPSARGGWEPRRRWFSQRGPASACVSPGLWRSLKCGPTGVGSSEQAQTHTNTWASGHSQRDTEKHHCSCCRILCACHDIIYFKILWIFINPCWECHNLQCCSKQSCSVGRAYYLQILCQKKKKTFNFAAAV